jgi:ABC-type transport system substrate-binding protein/class 3 adenylate cyclase
MTDLSTSPAPSRHDERRVITVLFADLVGSTALAERLDPEEVRLVVGDAISRIVTAIQGLDGYVKDIAGDGVLAFFGAPVGHEDDAERALRAALAITAEMERYAAEVRASWDVAGFGVRVGINTGPVVVGDVRGGDRVEYAAFGDTVNTAARLQSAAEPGGVLVAASTRRLLEAQFSWGASRELELKGKTAPVVAHELTGVASGAATEARAARHGALVGREREMRAGREAVGAVLDGNGGIVFLSGEPGIGKSRLIQELHAEFAGRRPQAGRALWLEGRCVSYGESLPYWPYRDLLRELIGVSRDEPELRARVALRRSVEQLFDEQADEIHPYLATMLGISLDPTSQGRVAHLSPEALRYRTFEVIGTLVSRLAADGPLAIVLDDLHWADPTSIALTEQLIPLVDDAPVLFLIAQRMERDHPSWQLKDRAARELPHRTTELALDALSGDAERELLEQLTGGELPSALIRRLLDVAEGNPFYLEELVRTLIDAGALVEHEGGLRFDHEVEISVPDSVEKVILARIDRLPAEPRQVLLAASVLGRRFSLPLLEEVAGDGDASVALRTLQRLDLIREGRRWPDREYRFKHALIQETAYRLLVTDDRRRLHRAAAEWLERPRDGHEQQLDLLAHHWLEAEDEERAIHYLTLAGDHASRSWALDEAIEDYRALVALLERGGERQEMAVVLFKLALALHTALRFAEANATYQRAFEAWTPPEPPSVVDATLRIGTMVMPTEADPARSYFLTDINLQMALYDRLVERWSESTIVPSLAERWTVSDDGLTYRFVLREGLRWSDGTPLTAEDVQFAVRRNLDPERPAASVGLYLVLEGARDYALRRTAGADRIGVRALDVRTVEFRLTAPAPYFLSLINRPDAGPLPRHAIERHGDAWTQPQHHIASGAYRQVALEDHRVELARRVEGAGHRRGNIARVVLSRMSDAEMLAAYEAGELELALPAVTGGIDHMVPSTPDELVLGPPAFLQFLSFDFSDPALRIAAVRKALAHAVDRQHLEELAPSHLAVASGGVVPPVLQGHTPDIALRHDPELARHLYQDAGRPTDHLRIVFRDAGLLRRMFVAIAEMWSSVLSIDVEPVAVDLETYLADRPFDVGPVVLRGWFPGYPDPEYFLRLLLHSDATDVTDDATRRYRSPAFDDLIERARQERDGRQRLELFHAADRLAITEDVAMIPLWYGRSPFLIKPRLHGWWEFGKAWSSFADLVLDER